MSRQTDFALEKALRFIKANGFRPLLRHEIEFEVALGLSKKPGDRIVAQVTDEIERELGTDPWGQRGGTLEKEGAGYRRWIESE